MTWLVVGLAGTTAFGWYLAVSWHANTVKLIEQLSEARRSRNYWRDRCKTNGL